MVGNGHKPLNPYIAGSALDGPEAFFGREDILSLVQTELRSPHQNAVVLFGQRRIGKTSILLQLRRRLPESGFVPVYLDLMDRARQPLGEVLAELADNVASELGLEPPERDRFDDHGNYFRVGFLPAVYRALSRDEPARRLVFLFDEFDVLALGIREELPPTAATGAFFPYLRELMAREKRLGFVIVVGRKTEDLSTDFRAAFRTARYQRVSVLKENEARSLIYQAEQEGLRYTSPAVTRILEFTAGHPYFTQLVCFLLFNRAWKDDVQGVPQVSKADVDAVVPQVLEAGNNAFEWVWDGLPPAERIVFSAIAEGTAQGQTLSEDQIGEILQQHGIRILISELQLAPRTLMNWEMLRRVDSGYRFFIELMRLWVAKNKPLTRVRDELDHVIPLADQHYQRGHTSYRHKDLPSAVTQLHRAVAANPNHFKAHMLLGICLREQGDLLTALDELEWAYEYDPQAARYELVRTLMQHGASLEKEGAEDEALATYERVLEVSPRERVARERWAAVHEGRGDLAFEADDYQAAIAAYKQAGVQEKVQDAEARQRQLELDSLVQRGEEATQARDWKAAISIYERMVALDPDDARWKEALEQARKQQRLKQRYTAGLGAVEQKQWTLARRALADVIYEQPDYKEASRYLHLAVAGQDATDLVDQKKTLDAQVADLRDQLEQERKTLQTVARRLQEVASAPYKLLPLWGWAVVALLALILFGGGLFLGSLLGERPHPSPAVIINSPTSGFIAEQGAQVDVVTTAIDDNGVVRVELLVDGTSYTADETPDGAPLSPYSLTQRWTASEAGEHTLSVKAFDSEGNASQLVSIVVQVVQPTPAP
ncbi:MAG: tetratricopeptide repeat protein [Anaerolineales bacterium]|nr:MAG: tetratricopeptide repeat protein [Anaerolineales bacterium]